ncbi:MAG: 6-hydroxymethylpterin diphosphokinase MptE-like protein [Thermoplasmatota archaeon]
MRLRGFGEWEADYEKILAEFGYARKADLDARDRLSELARGKTLAEDAALERVFAGATATLLGPAMRATRDIRALAPPIVVTDGAAAGAGAAGITPALVATDLDGDVAAQVFMNMRGSVVAVHAHGDNVARLAEWVPRFPGPLLLSTQAEPRAPVRNFGGFTDGDRAAALAVAYGATRLKLAGFDFDRPVERDAAESALKRKKLAWAKRLIDGLGVPVELAP